MTRDIQVAHRMWATYGKQVMQQDDYYNRIGTPLTQRVFYLQPEDYEACRRAGYSHVKAMLLRPRM
jgi:hypothetical protein